MGRKRSRHLLLWLALFLLVLTLAIVIRLRMLPIQEPVITNPVHANKTETAVIMETAEPEATPESGSFPEEEPASTDTEIPTESGPLKYSKESYEIVSDLVYTYAVRQREASAEIEADLARLKESDLRLGVLWDKILKYWDFVNEELPGLSSAVPAGLPEDDSLCIVVLGFQLHADGSMAEELVGRCETALALAEAYPQALLAVTGGGTAYQNRSVTEAGVMARWFMDHGIAAERILTEDRSLTTADNAVYTCEILRREAPVVKSLAIVTSDYHMPLGALLFEEKALLLEAEEGEKPFSVDAFAAYDTQGRYRSETPMEQKAYIWSVADPKY